MMAALQTELTSRDMSAYGTATLAMLQQILDRGVDHVALIMRHSAREFDPDRHDLENPLTDEGRTLAREWGRTLPKELILRGYTSPAERCVETAELILEGHRSGGGEVSRSRAVEGLGVFYVLDQMKMYRAMQMSSGNSAFLDRWFAGELDKDILIPSDLAARLVAHVVTEKLNRPLSSPQLDLLVSHDMTLYVLRDRLLGQSSEAFGNVEFLDALAFYREGGEIMMQSQHGDAKALSP